MSILTKQIALPKLSKPGVPSLRVRKPSLQARSSRRATGVVGLEIGATQAIAAQARLQGGQIVAERVAARPLPPGLMRDGLVTDPDRLASELKSFFSDHKFAKRVRVGLATPRTVLRVIDLPPLDEKDIRTALMMQAQERIPMPLDRAVMDFHTVGLVDTPDGQRLRVVVVVTEREGVDQLLDTLRRAGLRPEGIDLSVFSVIRALAHHATTEEPVLYAQLGDLVNIAIAESGLCRFTRQAPQGLAMVLGRLAENRGIPLDQAHHLLRDGDVDESLEDGALPVADLLKHTALELGSELRAAAEFYATQFGSVVTTGVVSGALAPLPGFVEALELASGLELVCGEVIPGSDDALGAVDPRIAAVATGLAIGALAS